MKLETQEIQAYVAAYQLDDDVAKPRRKRSARLPVDVLFVGHGSLQTEDLHEDPDRFTDGQKQEQREVIHVFDEFVEDMEQEITTAVSREKQFDIDHFFTLLNQMMYQEIEFFRYIAKEGNCADFRSRFRQAIDQILQVDFAENAAYPSHEKQIRSSLASVCINYAYLDWLAGVYGDISLDAVIDVTKNMLGEQLSQVKYRKISE